MLTRINLFGNLRISFAGQPLNAINTNRLQSLLAYLILHNDASQPRERLAFLLWPASSESQARTNLRQLLHHLKRALPAECDLLESTHFAVRWRQNENCAIDVVEFQAALADAAAAHRNTDRTAEIHSLTTAARLYEDDLLPGIYDDWLTPLREDYRKRAAEALARLAALFEEQKDYPSALPWADRLVALDPLSEPHHQLLIRLHAANRDRSSALRAYHQCMRVLRRELGVEPGPATIELFQRILKSAPAPEASTQLPAASPIAKPAPQLQKMGAFVGRTNEWHRLTSAWQSVIDGAPVLAVISGEPGIGKTRLADELYQACARHGHAAARTRCYAGQGQVAYAPVVDWLRSDPVRAAWAALRSEQVAELARLAPEIQEQSSDSQRSAARPIDRITENWQRLRLHESVSAAFAKSRKPLLLYLDDMQWCDSDSLEWLNALLTSRSAAGILVLATVRDEETGRDHPFTRFLSVLRQSGVVLEIPLEPLNAGETAELARLESSQPLEGRGLHDIYRATRGNPLFVVETVRAGFESTRVHAVISARLGQLTAPAYDLAGLASVIGRPFSFELLEKATDWDEASLTQALDELWRRRIIESRGASEYDFTHDRVREVAFAELSLVRQRYLHRRIARALADVYAADVENWDGQIASHAEQAGMAEEAIEHYQRAAGFARSRFAHSEAAALLRRALALCRDFPESERRLKQELDLLAMLGHALVATEGYSAPEVGDTYHRALALSERLDNRNIFAILSGCGIFHIVRGNVEKARQFSLDFLREAERQPAPGLMMAAQFLLGCCAFHLGELDESFRRLTAALRADDDSGHSVLALFAGPDLRVFCLSYLGHLGWHRQIQGDTFAAESIEAANRVRDPFSQAIALVYAALLHAFRGDSRAALERGQQAVDLCAKHGFAYYLAMGKIVTGWATAADAGVPQGLMQIRAGLEDLRALGAELRLPYYFVLLAETLARAGRPGEALASISSGFAFAAKNGEPWALAELYRVQGQLLAAEGKMQPAHASFEQGIQAARQAGSLAFERRLLTLLAPSNPSSQSSRTAASALSERF